MSSETLQKSNNMFTVKEMAFTAMFAVIIAVCSWISIPTTVPFTLQTFAVFASISMLGGKRGFFAVLVYIILGAVGIPVFAGFSGGIGVLFGSTGGYIIGFLLTALVCWTAEKLFGKKLIVSVIAMVIGLALCYAFGTAWFMFIYGRNTGEIGLATALSWCVVPFIIPDILKMVLAIVISKRVGKYVSL